jgi:hypothetical protein
MKLDADNIHDMCDQIETFFRTFNLSKDLEIEMWRMKRFSDLENELFDDEDMRQFIEDEVLSISSREIVDNGFLNCVQNCIQRFKKIETIKKKRRKKK